MELEKLLYLQGVGASYINCAGDEVVFPPALRLALLQAADPQLFDQAQLDPQLASQRVEQLDSIKWTTPLPQWQICQTDGSAGATFDLYLPSDQTPEGRVQLLLEQGGSWQFELGQLRSCSVGDYFYRRHYRQWRFSFAASADIPFGYHQLQLQIGDELWQGQWVHAPSQSFGNDDSAQRSWGLLLSLYTLRSERNWGIGDFGDLLQLTRWAASYGVDFIQLSPLHALDLANTEECSPYRSCDRRFINPLYIDVTQVVGYDPDLFNQPRWQQPLQQLRQADWLDYGAITDLKLAALALLFERYQASLEPTFTRRFNQFIEQSGALLQRFCQQQASALQGTLAEPKFHLFLQFIASDQLGHCQQQALLAGMRIGLIRDLAIGSAPDGFEISSQPQLYCSSASIGAPPDPFASNGQNWGLAPLSPLALAQQHYQPFIELLRHNMASAGALRIDHIMGLNRLWWWLDSQQPAAGGYLHYPQQTLLALLCLESQRQHCAVIGEDLGTVPPELAGALASSGIIANELLYFFRHDHGFKPPNQVKPNAMVMLANHDVSPLAGWWQGRDLQLRLQCQLLDQTQYQQQWQQRQQQLQQLAQWLGVDAATPQWQADWLVRLLARFAGGNARMVALQLDDLTGETEPVNLPGSHQQYRNWQRRLRLNLEQLISQQAPLMAQLQQAAERGFREARDGTVL
ncbi:4-alpha-glucanotransferase [Ferrimonas senticii]|uniref:4-alpha-glucanotransferase n=1 Tax=Ferrimonas senticii TaxID=394566 RepID=UPI000400EDC4|nr:4-alpha-glucanotransferase [Ferrimonas senticii]